MLCGGSQTFFEPPHLRGPSLVYLFFLVFSSTNLPKTKTTTTTTTTARHQRRGLEEEIIYHEMVGLSVVLEVNKDITKKAPQVISKASMNMIKPPSPAASCSSSSSPSTPSSAFNPFSRRSTSNNPSSFRTSGFLDHCFLCKQKLLPGRDIYMYKGDRAFCSEECRYRQIFMDEEVKAKTDQYCSFAAIKPQNTSTSPSSSRCRKGARNQANGFAC